MILLINPKTSKDDQIDIEQYFREPSLGLLYLAAILDSEELNVDILDLEQYYHLNNQELEDLIKRKIKPYNIFGITCLTNTLSLSLKIAKIIKNASSSNITIFGGPHATFQYEEMLKLNMDGDKLIDFVCIGESEFSFLQLVKILKNAKEYNKIPSEQELKRIKGLAFIDSDQKLIFSGSSNSYIDLEKIPLPARYLLPQENYKYTVANVIVNRGCPNQCSFCSRQELFKKTRLRNPYSIESEIRDIMGVLSYQYINFYDNININKTFFHKFCKMFSEKFNRDYVNVPWGCELRVDTISSEEANLIKNAGCQLVATGIESASQQVLKKNFKYQDPKLVKRGIKNLKKFEIPIQAYFVLGLPGETEETFQMTLDFIETLPLNQDDKINYFVATPYPGSKLWEERKSLNLSIVDENFDHFDCEHIIFETPELKLDKLKDMYREAKALEKKFSGESPKIK
jgi:radical SAM superfamily enzyme YgiQ (UPF0313 family)